MSEQPTGEVTAAKLRAANLGGDGRPEGTRASLARCAAMLDAYGPELFPADDNGQIHFARAMMEGVADEIAAYLSATDAFPELLTACRLWDEGFVDGEQLDAAQFLAWVNANRRAARDAVAKAVRHAAGA